MKWFPPKDEKASWAPIHGPIEKSFSYWMNHLAGKVMCDCCGWEPIQKQIDAGLGAANQYLSTFSPIEILLLTLLISYLLRKLWSFLSNIWATGIIATIFRCATKLPFVSGEIAKEKAKNKKEFWDKYSSARKDNVQVLPEQGWPIDKITTRMKEAEQYGRKCYKDGRHSGAVYHGGDEHWKLVSDVMAMHIVSNPVHID